jgi:hypothetical protein
MPSKVVVQSQAHLATHVSKVSHSAALRDTIPEGNQCVCMYDYRHGVYLYMCVWYSCAFDWHNHSLFLREGLTSWFWDLIHLFAVTWKRLRITRDTDMKVWANQRMRFQWATEAWTVVWWVVNACIRLRADACECVYVCVCAFVRSLDMYVIYVSSASVQCMCRVHLICMYECSWTVLHVSAHVHVWCACRSVITEVWTCLLSTF